jgi:hypothetical protein
MTPLDERLPSMLTCAYHQPARSTSSCLKDFCDLFDITSSGGRQQAIHPDTVGFRGPAWDGPFGERAPREGG